jgi:hypothetical protein
MVTDVWVEGRVFLKGAALGSRRRLVWLWEFRPLKRALIKLALGWPSVLAITPWNYYR